MPNSIALVLSYLTGLLDRVYQDASVTARFDAASELVRPSSVNPGTVYIPKISFDSGLSDYSATDGYVSGNTTLEWEPFKLTKDRGKALFIDAVENLESAGVALANMSAEFQRTKIVPEIDAYRITKYAAAAANTVEATLAKDSVETALMTALAALRDYEVPENRIEILMSNACYALLKQAVMDRRIETTTVIENGILIYDGHRIIPIPAGRFYTGITFNSDADGAGFKNSGELINFMAIDSRAPVQVTKHVSQKLITPEVNQTHDGWKWMYRIYHDAFVADNKKNGIYVHKNAASASTASTSGENAA